jgi:anti-sigma-K factor RskA
MTAHEEAHNEEGGDELVAAEYVLGTLDAPQRAIASVRIENDRAFAKLVERWEVRLEPLNEDYTPVAVPPFLKASIDRRLFGTEARQGLLSGVAFWRALAAGALAALVVSVWPQVRPGPVPPATGGPIVASLQADGGSVRFIALYEPGRDEIRMTTVDAEKAVGRDFELWLVDNGGKPVSMGILPEGGKTVVKLRHDLALRISDGDAFAISDEPTGGSPTGEATGPIIAVGAAKSI